MSCAKQCKRFGWAVGDTLIGQDFTDGVRRQFEITAIGKERILGTVKAWPENDEVSFVNGWEYVILLSWDNWRKL